MEIVWKNPSEVPQISRGKDIKVWGVVDMYEYRGEFGGLGANGKAERIVTLKEVKRRVIEIRYANCAATQEEIDFQQENGDFPTETPGDLDYWINDDGDYIGFTSFYHEYPEEGRIYYDMFYVGDDGELKTRSNWGDNCPGMVLIAWAAFEKPSVPYEMPEQTQVA
ncbi:hypothetical protein [Yersinia frederiksenii]|uniref:hypothetical protein n=1 Tax=Yersinia frederiksenii TaxID=29484 RepID=UPI0005DF6976|nr:hypothetical protein [Yersinia frederiksenii]CFR14735.1 Uncharacterised protein [Yersinia frederiksenii]